MDIHHIELSAGIYYSATVPVNMNTCNKVLLTILYSRVSLYLLFMCSGMKK